MELSPEERQRIYAEEKARVEAPQQSQKGKRSNLLLICLGIAVLLLLILATMMERSRGPERDDYMAQLMAEKFMKTRLIAPATADFGGEAVVYKGGMTYIVTGYVDAQNAFGAKLRKLCTCTVENTEAHKWIAHEPCGMLEWRSTGRRKG